jgi:hypothetical protein
MAAGGATAVVGRFSPALFGGTDPVIAGTAVNAAVLAAAWLVARFAKPIGQTRDQRRETRDQDS